MSSFSKMVITALFLASAVLAETVTIVEILDTNLYRTASGRLISLANVQTISIHDPDSLQVGFAMQTMTYLRKRILNKPLFVDFMTQDSVAIVHLWYKGVVRKKSLNYDLLHKGFGRLKSTPQSKQLGIYAEAAEYARIHHLGVHQPPRFDRLANLRRRAAWRQMSERATWGQLGVGFGCLNTSDEGGIFICPIYPAELTVHERRGNTLFSFGLFDEYILLPFHIWGAYCSIGHSFGYSQTESSLSGGLVLHYPINKDAQRHMLLLSLKFQSVRHGNMAGMGYILDFRAGRGLLIVNLEFAILFGKWNYSY